MLSLILRSSLGPIDKILFFASCVHDIILYCHKMLAHFMAFFLVCLFVFLDCTSCESTFYFLLLSTVLVSLICLPVCFSLNCVTE